MKLTTTMIALAILSSGLRAEEAKPVFSYEQERITKAKPWTGKDFQNIPGEFQFAIIGDCTGGANVEGTFKLAVDQLNRLRPEFVINVGDMIEGHSDKKAEPGE